MILVDESERREQMMTAAMIRRAKVSSAGNVGLIKAQRGLSMIEVLIALVVLAIGLLGTAAMQTLSLEGTANANTRSVALYLANDIIDRMRANEDGVTKGKYTDVSKAATTAKCSTAAGCDSEEMAFNDLQEWQTSISTLLPGGVGAISGPAVTGNANYVITVSWRERTKEAKAGGEAAAVSDANRFRTASVTVTTRP